MRQRSPEEEAAFRRAVDDAKQRYDLSAIVARDRKVVRVGHHEKRALCAFHHERTPSMHVNDAKGTFHCFGCGASGDLLTYVMRTQDLRFGDALKWLGGAGLPAVDPSERAKALAEEAAVRAAAIARAQHVWDSAVPAPGTPAETYLRSRGISAPVPASMRFGETPAWYDDDTGECGPDLPALIGAVVDGSERLVGLQRIFLADGGARKAAMRKPKLSLGRIKGGALRIGTGRSNELIVTEGPEDGLSLAQELGREVWVTLGTALMPFVEYPARVRTIVIAGQNDDAGRLAVGVAAQSLSDRGYGVRTIWPAPAFKDWNDQLRGIAA